VTTQNVPGNIPTPSLNNVEEWVASGVIGSGCTRRTTKYGHKLPKNKSKTTIVHIELFNQQSPKKRAKQKGKQEHSS